jgi:hypothetical protein
MAGSCEDGDDLLVSGATELVSYSCLQSHS